MSDQGLVAFYYDYERPARFTGEPQRCEGLVSKLYYSPGVDGMVKHAWNGLKYFLKRKDERRFDFDFARSCTDGGSYGNMNAAFDIFFRDEDIQGGPDTVEQLAYTLAGQHLSREEMLEHLFNCEGMYGWIFMAYTRKPDGGYGLRYGYCYENEVVTLGRALEMYAEHWHHDPEEVKSDPVIREALDFFRENAEPVSEEEFWSFEQKYGGAFLDKNLELLGELRR